MVAADCHLLDHRLLELDGAGSPSLLYIIVTKHSIDVVANKHGAS